MSRDELLAEFGTRKSAAGSQNTWGALEKAAAAACSVCGGRVTLRQASVTETRDGVTRAFHAQPTGTSCYSQRVRP